jgi:peptide deformylase
MSLLQILKFPDKRLNLVGLEVKANSAAIQQLIKDMFETMYASNGVGLAATQVNSQFRIFVMDLQTNEKKSPVCFINPTIAQSSGEIIWEEGCLSFPGVYVKVKRAHAITLNYLDEEFKPQTLNIDGGLLSVCIQHEIDHLDGITFFDRVSNLKKTRIRDKMITYNKKNPRDDFKPLIEERK